MSRISNFPKNDHVVKSVLYPMNFYFRNIILYTSFIHILSNIFIKSSWFEKWTWIQYRVCFGPELQKKLKIKN